MQEHHFKDTLQGSFLSEPSDYNRVILAYQSAVWNHKRFFFFPTHLNFHLSNGINLIEGVSVPTFSQWYFMKVESMKVQSLATVEPEQSLLYW